MLLQQGNIQSFGDSPWYAVELCGDGNLNARTEEAIFSIARWAAKRRQPIQLFVPIASYGPDGISLLGPYIWVRAGSLKSIWHLASHSGVKADYEDDAISHRRSKAEFIHDGSGGIISVENSFVQEMIDRCHRTAASWSKGIRVGNYVRILCGPYRMFSGKVTRIAGSTAHLNIQLRVRLLRIQSPLVALENLGPKPRDYYN